MAEKIKFFKCISCSEYSPFDLNKTINSNVTVTCTNCNKKWIASYRTQNCCRVEVIFCSVENSGQTSIKKIQSFSKR